MDKQGSVSVELTQGFVAIIDAVDAERVLQYSWQVHRAESGICYAKARVRLVDGGIKVARMHRFILGITDPKILVDHWDCDGLNNRRLNLRPCSHGQNLANQRKTRGSSRFKGVSWSISKRRWKMSCAQKIYLEFDDEEEAARAYDAAALRIFGPFARLNFPQPTMTTTPGERQ